MRHKRIFHWQKWCNRRVFNLLPSIRRQPPPYNNTAKHFRSTVCKTSLVWIQTVPRTLHNAQGNIRNARVRWHFTLIYCFGFTLLKGCVRKLFFLATSFYSFKLVENMVMQWNRIELWIFGWRCRYIHVARFRAGWSVIERICLQYNLEQGLLKN